MRLIVSEFIKNEILLNLEQICESKRTSINKAVASVMKDWQLDTLTAADLVFDWWDTLKHYNEQLYNINSLDTNNLLM